MKASGQKEEPMISTTNTTRSGIILIQLCALHWLTSAIVCMMILLSPGFEGSEYVLGTKSRHKNLVYTWRRNLLHARLRCGTL